MRWIMRIIGVVFVALLVIGGVYQYAAESREVVVLTTTDSAGDAKDTRLWVVDLEGYQYLRAGFDGATWYQRLIAEPQVEVIRQGEGGIYTAIPDPNKTPEINDLMADKYGWADTYVGMLFGRGGSIAVRLDPVDAE